MTWSLTRVRRLFVLLILAAGALVAATAAPQEEVTRVRDVIYGRKHGVVLTMDVFRPARPNGIGVLFVVSGGWFSSHEAINEAFARPFTSRGATVFAVVHGSQPKYTIPEIVKDIDRATRFVRTHAREYGVDPNRLGIAGASAGGHLSLMQGARGGPGDPNAKDVVDRASSKVQAVACFFPPTDFLNYGEPGRNVLKIARMSPFFPAFGVRPDDGSDLDKIARETSPVTYLTRDMPPTLVIHGDADDLVPIQQAQVLMKRLEELGVPHRLVVREKQGHGWPTILQDFPLLMEWFEEHLRAK